MASVASDVDATKPNVAHLSSGTTGSLLSAGSTCRRSLAAPFTGQSDLTARAILPFLDSYGAAAGNTALSTVATGAVWLGGGIARTPIDGPAGTSAAWRTHARTTLLSRFRDKGRLVALLKVMPAHIIITDEAPLLGVARFALAEQSS